MNIAKRIYRIQIDLGKKRRGAFMTFIKKEEKLVSGLSPPWNLVLATGMWGGSTFTDFQTYNVSNLSRLHFSNDTLRLHSYVKLLYYRKPNMLQVTVTRRILIGD